MVKQSLIYFIFAGVFSGILFFEFFDLDKSKIFFTVFLTLILLIFLVFLNFIKDKNFKIIFSIILIAFCVSLIQISFNLEKSKILDYEKQKIIAIGKIIKEPDLREHSQRITVNIEEIEINNQKIFTNENAILTISKYKDLNYLDKVIFNGQVNLPENFDNENGIEFDYVNFLAKDNIYTTFYYPNIINIEKNNNLSSVNIISKNLFKFKTLFLEKVSTIIPSPESELLGGILLGTKRSLGKELESDFRRVGLIHIVVLSGYNVTIIVEAVLKSLFFLPKIFSLITGSIFIFMFSIMVGSGATIIRASIMAILALISRIFNKRYSVNRALFLSAIFMLLQNHKILLYDPSFQLSFLATWGLINFGNILDKKMNFLPKRFGFKELTIATISTQLSVLPLLIKMTGEISIISLPVNLIVLPFVPITMLFGFLTGMFSFIYLEIAKIFGYVSYFFLLFIVETSKYFSSFEFSVLKLTNFNFLYLILFYGLIVIFLYFSPIQIFKKIIYIITFTARLIIKNK